MDTINRSRLERETIILFNDEEEMATIGTCSPTIYRRLTRRLGPATVLSPGSWSWSVDKKHIILPRLRAKRSLTPEHRAKLGARLKKKEKV